MKQLPLIERMKVEQLKWIILIHRALNLIRNKNMALEERKYFKLWMEGYCDQGSEGVPTKARLLGTYQGFSLQDAFRNFIRIEGWDAKYANFDKPSYWACRVFDNEKDARKSFR